MNQGTGPFFEKKRMNRSAKGLSGLVRELRSRQKNIVWPDPLRNSRNVDEFLWRGSPNATPVQRLGATIFGVFFGAIGAANMDLGHEHHSTIQFLIGLLSSVLGLRILINAFRRKGAKH
jgi:hypothetical protein